MSGYVEREISEKTDLCQGDGTLNPDVIGWARHPLMNCNLKGRWLRKKKWNYWCVISKDCLFSATVSNIDYVGMVFVYFLDFKTKRFTEKTIMTPFGAGCAMPPAVHDDVIFRAKNTEISLRNSNGETRLIIRCGDFGGERLEADIRVFYPEGYETLNVVIPWNKRTFQFTSKHEGMPVSGSVKIGEHVYDLNEEAYGCLDFGRGIWPYQVSWNWLCASGLSNGKRIGLNLGGQWTDNTGMNENAVVVDGKLSKISADMIFEYDKGNLMKPWRVRDVRGEWVDLAITPFFERIAKSNLGIIVSEVHQMIGHISGRVKTSDGDYIALDNVFGAVEDHLGKW